MSEAILDSAAMFPEPLLRSLDAIHLASAQSITAVTAVLASISTSSTPRGTLASR